MELVFKRLRFYIVFLFGFFIIIFFSKFYYKEKKEGIHSETFSKIEISDDSLKNCFNNNNLKEIIKIVKKQKNIPVFNLHFLLKAKIRSNAENCIGLYFLYSTKTCKKYNLKIYIPFLKFNDKITVNSVYVNGKSLSNDTIYIKKDIDDFKNNYKLIFKDEKIDEILNIYKLGVQFAPKNNYYYSK